MFLGSIPIEPKLAASAENGANFIASFAESEAAKRFAAIFSSVLATANDNEMDTS